MTTETYKIKFEPNRLQKPFIESEAEADLFSSRMGEGKSAGLSWSVLYHTKHNPGATWAVIRDTWENLRATTQKEFFKWFPPGIMGTYHATNKEFTWASGVADGTVMFLGMDAPDDATKLMSRSLSGFAMDEPAPAVGSAGISEEVFTIAMSRRRENPTTTRWYAAKLAENNPDEAHWTYKKFVDPGTEGYKVWQPNEPENLAHLPVNYYANMRRDFAGREDLIRRFVDGEFGFQSEGKPVTPQWSDRMHLTFGLHPLPRLELVLLWDFGHNPTCIITQKTPLGNWNILEALVGDGIGATELIEQHVLPLLSAKYRGHSLRHIGDPTGSTPDQSTIARSPVIVIKRKLGGVWMPGPVKPGDRIPPLQRILTQSTRGRGIVQVDKANAAAVWHALRGGYHFHVARTGLISTVPHKNIHSHPGDAMTYGAAVLFPLHKAVGSGRGIITATPQEAAFFQQDRGGALLGPGRAGMSLPTHGSKL